jgi:hypothetical protein
VLPHIDPAIPVAVVSNFVEAHFDFLNRAGNVNGGPSPLDTEAYHADRTLLWVGDPKLVFVSHEIPHAAYLCDLLGYAGTRHLAPDAPSPFLSRDILREQRLLDELVRYAGPQRRIQIVPYATTPDFLALVDALRREHGLHVLLPESPAPDALWLRDYVDTKSGFHHLAGRWLPSAGELLPQAYACGDLRQAARAARWFHAHGRACIAKPDTGESGLGSVVMDPSGSPSVQEIVDSLQHNPYWGREPILVEEYIAGSGPDSPPVSPSVEVFVPHRGAGEPAFTYVSEQLFQGFGEFSGVLVSRDQNELPWYAPCVESSLLIARELQARGYVGHFDIDAVLDGSGRPYLLELNARRTGGTHVHDFGCSYFGDDYVDTTALLSWESVDCGEISDWQALLAALEGLLFPIAGAPRGVVVTITSALQRNQCGVMIAGTDRQDALQLQAALVERLQAHARVA